MTVKQISLVKSSWRMLMKLDPQMVGGLFYDKLFFDHPEARRLFKTSKEEQAKKLIDMINMVIMRLDRLDELSEDIRQLAIRHIGYGTKPVHYDLVGAALLWTLERGMGQDWNLELKEAWATCYQMLAETMIRASEEYTERQTG